MKAFEKVRARYADDIRGMTPEEMKPVSWDYASELDAIMAEERIKEGVRIIKEKRSKK